MEKMRDKTFSVCSFRGVEVKGWFYKLPPRIVIKIL